MLWTDRRSMWKGIAKRLLGNLEPYYMKGGERKDSSQISLARKEKGMVMSSPNGEYILEN